MRTLVILLLAACGAKPAPEEAAPGKWELAEPQTTASTKICGACCESPPPLPPRSDYTFEESPVSLVLVGHRGDGLVWTSSVGAVWNMSRLGGQPERISDPGATGF